MAKNIFEKNYKGKYAYKNLKYIPDDIKCVKNRLSKGWCHRDWFNMDSWFLSTIPDMLDEMAEKHQAYPIIEGVTVDDLNYYDGNEAFKRWTSYLKEMAQHFRNADEELCPEKNQYESDIWVRDDIDKWQKRSLEIMDYRNKELETAFNMMSKVFFHLWD